MIVLVIVLWLTNGDVVSRHDIVPPGMLCEVQAKFIEEHFKLAENVEDARAVCVHKGQPI